MRFRKRPPDDDVTQEWVPPAPPPEADEQPRRKRGIGRRIVWPVFKVLAGYWVFCVALLAVYRFVWPPVTGVQLQRRIEAMASGREYRTKRTYVRMERMPAHVPRAVMAAEDGRFRQHRGFDLVEMRNARRDALEGGRMRGASTITQQLMKNLFGCACRNPVLGGFRKLYDWTLTPVAEVILGKDRILELYLNSVEWGDGVWGVEAGARHHYGRSARQLTRSQAAGLAALLPNPRRRTPESTGAYRRDILRRMSRRGW
jgi:monofunctional biosynthetic peptidoglycan transglycosylase